MDQSRALWIHDIIPLLIALPRTLSSRSDLPSTSLHCLVLHLRRTAYCLDVLEILLDILLATSMSIFSFVSSSMAKSAGGSIASFCRRKYRLKNQGSHIVV